jgi:hypothetical protein
MVGKPTVTIPFCMLFRTVIPDTVEMMVKVCQRDNVGYVIASVASPRSSVSWTEEA